MVVTRRYLIAGRVQGVGFRLFAEDAASREGMRGFVRNLDDGRVEAVGEGEHDAMARFAGALHQGPPLAHVTHVTVEELAPLGPTGGFFVRD